MAKLHATGGVYEIEWQITDLAYPFNSKYYICAGVTPYEVPYGVAELPEKGFYYDQVDAPGSRTAKSTPIQTSTASPGTYTLYGYAQDASNGLYYPAGVVDDIKVKASNPDPINATFKYDKGTTAIEFTIEGLYAGQYGYCYVWDENGDPVWDEGSPRTYFDATGSSDNQKKTITLSSLLPGGLYYINVLVYSDGEEAWLRDSDEIIVMDDVSPKFDAYLPSGIDGKTSVNIEGWDMLAGGYVMIYVYEDATNKEIWGSYTDGSYISLGSLGSFSDNFGGLSPGTLYRIAVSFIFEDRNGNSNSWRAQAVDEDGYNVDKLYILTLKKPEEWSWKSTIEKDALVKIRASEWNDFTKRINDVREYSGLKSESFTEAIGGSTQVGATICNKARDAIYYIENRGTLPNKAVAGSPLSASFFNLLASALNDAIKKLE